MSEHKEKTVGIIGGMGPEATVDLMQRIIRLTPARDDIDHIRCVVDNDPKIPSRIKAIIEGGTTDPGEYLGEMAKRLESWGTDFLAMPCNTAHYYFDRIQAAVRIPVIHMIDAVLDHIRQQFPDCKKVGILASPAIRITGIYNQKFNPAGIDLVFPAENFQHRLFDLIRKIKAQKAGPDDMETYQAIFSHLQASGAQVFIIACTELSTVETPTAVPWVDASQILAQKIVDTVKNGSPV